MNNESRVAGLSWIEIRIFVLPLTAYLSRVTGLSWIEMERFVGNSAAGLSRES